MLSSFYRSYIDLDFQYFHLLAWCWKDKTYSFDFEPCFGDARYYSTAYVFYNYEECFVDAGLMRYICQGKGFFGFDNLTCR